MAHSTADPVLQVVRGKILTCVHCGLCLESCPTYRETRREQDSPRGRIYIMKSLLESPESEQKEMTAALDRCLGCRACETSCPAGVPYGELLELSRARTADQGGYRGWAGIRERIMFFLLFSGDFRRLWFSKLMRICRLSGLQTIIGRLLNMLPDGNHLVFFHRLLPEFSGQSFKSTSHPELLQSVREYKSGKPRMSVALFTGCVMDIAESHIHRASALLLRASGCKVAVPEDQTCCGAVHLHSGRPEEAERLSSQNHRVFKNYDAVLLSASGCSARLREAAQGDAGSGQPAYADIMQFFADNPELLQEITFDSEECSVFYDAPCHLRHAQNVDAGPKKILASLPGVRLIPLSGSDWCCGAAGTYNLVQPGLSRQILRRKVDSVREALSGHPGTGILLSGNPGCILQITAGLNEAGISLGVKHPVVFMAERLAATSGNERIH